MTNSLFSSASRVLTLRSLLLNERGLRHFAADDASLHETIFKLSSLIEESKVRDQLISSRLN